jgi:hypothetical protein
MRDDRQMVVVVVVMIWTCNKKNLVMTSKCYIVNIHVSCVIASAWRLLSY